MLAILVPRVSHNNPTCFDNTMLRIILLRIVITLENIALFTSLNAYSPLASISRIPIKVKHIAYPINEIDVVSTAS